MLKNIYSAIIVSCISIPALAVPANDPNNQLMHVQNQIKAVTRSWQKTEITLRQAKKTAGKLYQQLEATARKLLSNGDVTTKIDTLVEEQFHAIATDNMPYKAIDILADYFPQLINAIKDPLLKTVCLATVNKKFRTLLGKKLTTKERELNAAITIDQNQDFAMPAYNQ